MRKPKDEIANPARDEAGVKAPGPGGMGWEGKRMSGFEKIQMAFGFWDPWKLRAAHESWRREGIMN